MGKMYVLTKENILDFEIQDAKSINESKYYQKKHENLMRYFNFIPREKASKEKVLKKIENIFGIKLVEVQEDEFDIFKVGINTFNPMDDSYYEIGNLTPNFLMVFSYGQIYLAKERSFSGYIAYQEGKSEYLYEVTNFRKQKIEELKRKINGKHPQKLYLQTNDYDIYYFERAVVVRLFQTEKYLPVEDSEIYNAVLSNEECIEQIKTAINKILKSTVDHSFFIPLECNGNENLYFKLEKIEERGMDFENVLTIIKTSGLTYSVPSYFL